MGHTQFIATAYILKMLSDERRFEKFLIGNHAKESKKMLKGVKLLFGFVLDEHIRHIESGNGFTLKTDRMTQRALYVGADIREISSNSHRAKVLRSLRSSESLVVKSKTLSEYFAAISTEFKPWFIAIEKLWSKATAIVNPELNSWKKTDVRTLQIFSSLLMLLNIKNRLLGFMRYEQRWRKLAKGGKKNLWGKEFAESFFGYKVAAAYLWDSFQNRYTPQVPVKEILAAGDWGDLDYMYREVADGIVAKADGILGSSRENSFHRTRKYNPIELKLMMKEAEFKNGRKLYDILDESLLWYDIELLDTAGRKLFTGVSTFVNLLVGAVTTKRNHSDNAPIEVRRILHPGGTGSNNISYAVLIPMYSNMADYSGWVVSLFCATDYSGFGNAMRKFAEDAILQFSRDIIIKDIDVDMDQFRAYLKYRLKQRSRKGVWGYLTPTERETLYYSESIDIGIDLSAIVMELFMGAHLAETGYNVKWQYRDKAVLQKFEIDVLAYNRDTVQIIECSRHLPINERGIQKKLKEFMKKRELIEKSNFSRRKIILRYITVKDITRAPFLATARVFKKEGIDVEDIAHVLEKSQHRKKPLRELLWQIDHLRDHSSVRFTARKFSTNEITADEIHDIMNK